MSTLDQHLDEIVELKLVGASDAAVANRLGVDRSTVTRFCQKPMVRKAIDQAQHDLVTSAVRKASTAAGQAISVLIEAIDPKTKDVPWPIRIRAASEITKMVGIERMASAMEVTGQTVADALTASDSIRQKAELMEQRIIEAESTEMPPLRVVE